jgi:hypothetical protein
MEASGHLQAPAALPRGNRLPYELDRRLGGPQTQSGRYEDEKNLAPALAVQPVVCGYIDLAIPTDGCLWIWRLKEGNIGVLYVFRLYIPYYVSSYEKGIESEAGKTGQDIKWQVKWLDLSMRLLGTLKYTLGITF